MTFRGKNIQEKYAWETPDDLFKACDEKWGPFTLDAAAGPTDEWATEIWGAPLRDEWAWATNAKCAEYLTDAEDGLAQPWSGRIWCNPPYGRGVTAKWVAKANAERNNTDLIVMLLPVSSDTAWWHDHVMSANEIFLLRGRPRFNGAKGGGTFASAIVVYRPFDERGPSFYGMSSDGVVA